MALTTADKQRLVRKFIRREFQRLRQTATVNLDDMVVAMGEIEGTFDSLPPDLPNQAADLLANFNAGLSQPVKGALTTEQKWFLLAIYSLEKAGMVDGIEF